MAFVVVQDEQTNPADITLFGSPRKLTVSSDVAALVEELLLDRRWIGRGGGWWQIPLCGATGVVMWVVSMLYGSTAV